GAVEHVAAVQPGRGFDRHHAHGGERLGLRRQPEVVDLRRASDGGGAAGAEREQGNEAEGGAYLHFRPENPGSPGPGAVAGLPKSRLCGSRSTCSRTCRRSRESRVSWSTRVLILGSVVSVISEEIS